MLRRLEADADRAGLPPVLMIPAVANALASMSSGQHVLGRIQYEARTAPPTWTWTRPALSP